MAAHHPTLDGSAYHDESVFAAERERILHGGWFYVGRSDPIAPGDRLVVDVAGESVLIVRDRDGRLHAHANVCRHRGARLCSTSGPGSRTGITCPYHAFTYALDGRLIGTPNVGPEELDRGALSLWSIAVDEWQGFMFVHVAADPPPLLDWFEAQGDWSPVQFADLDMGNLRVGFRTENDVAANWKIIVDNYMECLHCPQVHPELVDLIPLYRSGAVLDDARADGGVPLTPGSNSFSAGGRSRLPLLPSMPASRSGDYQSALVYPNMFLDITGTSVVATALHPKAPDMTTVVTEYLFAPETIADPGFDPSEVVDFSELVARQDAEVCAITQSGTASRFFDRGALAEKDSLIVEVNERYRRLMS